MPWAQIEALIASKRHSELVTVLSQLDNADRKALVAPLRAFSRSQDEHGMPLWDLFSGIALAGAAILPDAKSVASWIRRFAEHEAETAREGSPDVHAEDLARVLIAREPAWHPNLINQLADHLRHNVYIRGPYTVVERLRSHLDAPPPRSPGYVAGWALFGWSEADLVTILSADQRFADLVPLVMENDDLAGLLRDTSWGPGRVRLVIDALDAGLADRSAVLDALLARLQRGGRPKPTNDFVAVHDALAPSMDEVVERRRDYLALLPAPTAPTVAGMAQRILIAALAVDRLTMDELEEASRSVLIRAEKKLVRTQLAALRDHSRRNPSDLPRVVDMAATAFDNAAPDLQRDAAKLVAGWLPTLDAAARNNLIDRAAALPADLSAMLGASPLAAPVPVPRLTAPERTRVLAISSAEELVEELLLALRSEGSNLTALSIDRILEAIPRIGGDDRQSLRAAAAPVLGSDEYRWAHTHHEYTSNWNVSYGLIALLDAALDNPVKLATEKDGHRFDRTPQRVITTRVYAAARALRDSPNVRCVSLPSWSDGVIEAPELRERLAAAERGGWIPDPIDLEQATLRVDPAEARPMGMISPPAPSVTFVERKERHFSHWDGDLPPPPIYLPIPVLTPAPDDVSRGALWTSLRSLPAPPGDFMLNYDTGSTFQAWALIAPHHADLIAAHLCLEQIKARDRSSEETGVLVGVASAPGSTGPGLYAAIAYGLGAKKSDRQAAAVDALLVLAARNRFDGHALGAILGRIVAQRGIVLKRICPPLSDVARAGAATPAWNALREVLETVLSMTPTPSGLPDLLSTAAEIATLANAHESVPGLTELAARKGHSRQVVEARRLVTVLA